MFQFRVKRYSVSILLWHIHTQTYLIEQTSSAVLFAEVISHVFSKPVCSIYRRMNLLFRWTTTALSNMTVSAFILVF